MFREILITKTEVCRECKVERNWICKLAKANYESFVIAIIYHKQVKVRFVCVVPTNEALHFQDTLTSDIDLQTCRSQDVLENEQWQNTGYLQLLSYDNERMRPSIDNCKIADTHGQNKYTARSPSPVPRLGDEGESNGDEAQM